MESAVLERALQASTAEAAAAPQNGATARQEPAPVAVPADGAIWFAMLHGKQTGPLTRAELDARANEGEVGPRTYLWRDGMDSWQRAKDVPELGSLFPQLPPAPGPASASGPAAKAGVASGQAAKTAAASSAAAKTAAPARSVAVPWPEPPRSEPPHSEPPRSEPARPEVARSEPPRSEPARSEPPLPDSVWVSTRADAQRAETGRSEPQAAEAERFDPLRSDSPWPETQQSSDPTAPMPRSVSADIIAEERAQTEEIARQLFASGEHSISQKNALDLARWASDEMGGHKTPARAAEQPKIAPALPATPMFTSATPRRMGRGALIAAIAVVVVAVVVMVIWALGGSSTDHPDEPGRPPQARSQPSPAPAPSQSEVTPEPAEAQAQAKPIEVAPQLTPSGPPQGPLTAEQLRRKLDEAKPALQLCVDRALPKEKVHVGRIHISTTIAPTGQVTAARIDKRTVDESALGTCLKRATQKITFPAFSGSPFDLDIPIVVTAGE